MGLTDTAAAALRHHHGHIHRAIGVIQAGPDPAGPHQTRVGLRRLRTALRLFRAVLPPGAATALARDARWLAAEIGVLRDLDVIAAEMVVPLMSNAPDHAGLADLHAHLHAAAADRRAGLRGLLRGGKAQALLADLDALSRTAPWQADPTTGLRGHARRQLARRWRGLTGDAAQLDRMTVKERHEFRKGIKKLRYGVDLVGEPFKPARVSAFRRRLKSVQDGLGQVNDAATAVTVLTDPDAPWAADPLAQRAVGWVLAHQADRAEAGWRRASAEWREIAAQQPFWA